jgi:hypothetical protein
MKIVNYILYAEQESVSESFASSKCVACAQQILHHADDFHAGRKKSRRALLAMRVGM